MTDRADDASADGDEVSDGQVAESGDESGRAGGATTAGRSRCDYCRLPLSTGAVELRRNGDAYAFCSDGCRDALESADRVFTQFHGHRRTPTGVDPVDESLPQGVPRNSFVMLTDLAGTRTEAIRAELAWRALERGEPAVMVSFLEPAVSVVQQFVTLDWNVLPYLESGQLGIVDAFTYRMDDRERMYDRFDDWNAHLSGFCEPATQHVRDPSDTEELQNRIDEALETRNMDERGVVVVDSLNEFGSHVQPVQAYRFVKDLRATVPKSRFVPVYASATVSSEERGFPHDLDYMVDGIVEMQLNEELVPRSLIKQIRVRKMRGVLSLPQWTAYEYTAGEGIVTVELPDGDAEDDGRAAQSAPPDDAPASAGGSAQTERDGPDGDTQPGG